MNEKERKAKEECKLLGLHANERNGYPINFKTHPTPLRNARGEEKMLTEGWGLMNKRTGLHVPEDLEGYFYPYGSYWEALCCRRTVAFPVSEKEVPNVLRF